MRRRICERRETLQRVTGPLSIMYGSMEESTPAAEAPALGPADCRCRRLRRHRRIAPRRARALASKTTKSTPIAALHAARGAARPDIPTPVRSLSMRRRARRRIQISSLFAAEREDAATRAACRRTNGTARGRPPVSKFSSYILRPPHKNKEEKPATALLPMKGGVVAAPRTRPTRRAPSRRS